MMHFDFSFSLGNIVTLVAIVAMFLRVDRIAAKFLVEHEILVADYCKRTGIEVRDLPTRIKSLIR
jgi:hypothetical protein